MEYPFHVHDVHISDPFILADETTGKYYLYAASSARSASRIRSGAGRSMPW